MSSTASGPWRVASLSDTGTVRVANQDACQEFGRSDGWRLLVVADGMGGHAGGERASQLALEAIGQVFAEGSTDAEALLRRAYEAANAHILETAGRDVKLEGMGTTAVALLLRPDGAWTANVGDSRLYRLRGRDFELLTEDHSWVQVQVRKGHLSLAEAEGHPYRNRLVRCLGYDSGSQVDIQALDLEVGDTFLLCSDGLWGELAEDEMARVLGDEEPAQAVRTLVSQADRNGGRDNITAVVAKVGGRSASQSRPVAPPTKTQPLRRWLRGFRKRASRPRP